MEFSNSNVDKNFKINYPCKHLSVRQENMGQNGKVYTIESVGARCIKIYVNFNAYQGGKIVITNTNFCFNGGEIITDLLERELEIIKHSEGGSYRIVKFEDEHTKPDVVTEKIALQDACPELYFKIINEFLNEKFSDYKAEGYREAFNIILPLLSEDVEKLFAMPFSNNKTI